MPKLKMKEIPILNRSILRQMISGRGSIETLHELCDCGTVRVRRRIIVQHNTQVIRVSGLLGGSTLPESDGGSGRHRRRGRSRQIARDLVNLRGREAVLFFLFAATAKNCEKATNSQQSETC